MEFEFPDLSILKLDLTQILYFSQIKKILEGRSQYKISKTKMAGSYGKKTSIISSDIDIVIFIKDVCPPFEHVIREFETILKGIDWITHVESTKYSLQFKAKNYEFDLLPASDLVPNQNIGAHNRVQLQQRRVLKEMKKKSTRNAYSSSLAFSTVDFMKRQSSFAKEIVRIAKFWYKSACITESISGAKYAMELIAVDAANHVENQGNSSLSYYAAFSRFLETVQDFDNMDIVFDYTFDKISRKHWPAEEVDFVRLIDPANPYNNLANNFSDDVIEVLRDHASETLSRLQDYNRSAEYRLIVDIFHPELFNTIHNRSVHIRKTDDENTGLKSREIYQNVTIRGHRRLISDFERRQMEFMHIYLKGLCQQLCDDYDWDELPLEEFISIWFADLSEQHHLQEYEEDYFCEDFDVSLWLNGPNDSKFRLSFDLEDDSESGPEYEPDSDSETVSDSEDDYESDEDDYESDEDEENTHHSNNKP